MTFIELFVFTDIHCLDDDDIDNRDETEIMYSKIYMKLNTIYVSS